MVEPEPMAAAVDVFNTVVTNLLHPKTFGGLPGESADDWLDNFVLISRANGLEEDKYVNRFCCYLEGPARAWYRSAYTEKPPKDWATLKDDFQKIFGSSHPALTQFEEMRPAARWDLQNLSRSSSMTSFG